jgi:hypothetical protein
MIGQQSFNPLTNVNLVGKRQGKHIAEQIYRAERESATVEVTHKSAEMWNRICHDFSLGRVWDRKNNWYNKRGTIEPSANYWGTVAAYLEYIDEFKSDINFNAIQRNNQSNL